MQRAEGVRMPTATAHGEGGKRAQSTALSHIILWSARRKRGRALRPHCCGGRVRRASLRKRRKKRPQEGQRRPTLMKDTRQKRRTRSAASAAAEAGSTVWIAPSAGDTTAHTHAHTRTHGCTHTHRGNKGQKGADRAENNNKRSAKGAHFLLRKRCREATRARDGRQPALSRPQGLRGADAPAQRLTSSHFLRCCPHADMMLNRAPPSPACHRQPSPRANVCLATQR